MAIALDGNTALTNRTTIMNAIKAIFLAIASFAQVFVKLANASEKVANSLNNLAEVGEVKSENFVKLAKLNDEATFMEEQEKIQQRRERLKMDTTKVASKQEELKLTL